MTGGSTFGKTICTICYEDLKPVIEDLQSISICGHVFHELCLQQWFEYCSEKKKNSCPVCKQTCLDNNVCRLYFQSVSDSNDPVLSQKPVNFEEDPKVLRCEMRKLEVKVTGLNSALEGRQKELKELQEELYVIKEQAKKEAALKSEAMRQKTLIQNLLNSRAEELDRTTLERSRLQERNMALAKELAAFRLITDLNLEEDGVLKLASLGNEGNNKDTIDILKKSLVIRNKSYKELMAKCNLLGREEAHTLKKYAKAKEKNNALRKRVRELETEMEVKETEVLRALKASKRKVQELETEIEINDREERVLKVSNKRVRELETDMELKDTEDLGDSRTSKKTRCDSSFKIDQTRNSSDDSFGLWKTDSCKNVGVNNKEQERDSYILIDEDDLEIPKGVDKLLNPDLKHQTREDMGVQKSSLIRPESASDNNKGTGVSGLRASTTNDDMTLLVDDDFVQVEPLLHIRKETSSPIPLSEPGDRCFSGGLLGPDGKSRHLGKWCKQAQAKRSVAMQEGSSTGELISIGADGRGGRIKVLRSIDQSSNGKEGSVWAKKCKGGAKKGTLQSQGCMQIENFFSKVGR